jgi:hypothetical protein
LRVPYMPVPVHQSIPYSRAQGLLPGAAPLISPVCWPKRRTGSAAWAGAGLPSGGAAPEGGKFDDHLGDRGTMSPRSLVSRGPPIMASRTKSPKIEPFRRILML